MHIIYCIDNKLGGITSLNYNVINSRPGNRPGQWVIHIDKKESTFTRANINFGAEKELFFSYSDKDNLYSVIKQLRSLIPDEKGALVLNDSLEMEMLDHFPVQQTVYQMVHDDYNLTLAQRYHHVVDVFIAHSLFFYEALKKLFPEHANRIFYLPHGVPVPDLHRLPNDAEQPIRLLFLGRMTSKKGIFDLPEIDRLLHEWNVPHSWTCIGNGPELKALQNRWSCASGIRFCSPPTNEEVIQICSESDVFVLPTQFEGSPVSLLETMSSGLVPVITDLPGGIQDIVKGDIGFRIPQGDIRGFAGAIRQLSDDRDLLNKLSKNCRNKIIERFHVRDTAGRYHDLFGRCTEFYRNKHLKRMKIGSRLDQPWLPGVFTKALRSVI